jgi:hypothetical protein
MAFNGSVGTAALLLPMMVAGESHIQTESAGTATTAAAHVNFKIVIPKVLYLRVSGGNDRIPGAETVAVMSNSRNVALNASVRTTDSDVHARGVVLGASARKTIAQDAPCTLGGAHPVTVPAGAHGPEKAGDRQVICTVSMP